MSDLVFVQFDKFFSRDGWCRDTDARAAAAHWAAEVYDTRAGWRGTEER